MEGLHLECVHAEVGKGVLEPLGEPEAPVGKVAVEGEGDAQQPSHEIEPRRRPERTPAESPRGKEAENVHR